VIYALTLAGVSILAWLSILVPRSAHALGLIVGVMLMLLAGLRGDSVDYPEYLLLYELMNAAESIELPARLFLGKDLLFGALMATVIAAGGSGPVLFAASAVISVGVKIIAFNRAFGQAAVPLFASLALFFFLHDFTQVRVGIALAWLYWALVEFSLGRPGRALALALVGTLFHASAGMLLLYGPALRMRGVLRLVAAGLLTALLVLAMPIALDLLDVLGARGELDEGKRGTSGLPIVLALIKIALLTWMLPTVRARSAAALRPLLDHCLLLCWVAVVFILGFQTASSALAFRTYELFDAFSVFIVAAALINGTLATRAAALALCIVAMVVYAQAGLLFPYSLAAF
jgi:EpsG family